MTTKTRKHTGDQLFHAISRENDPTTVHFMYFCHHKVESTQVINILPCILSEELLINPNDFITRSGIGRVAKGKRDKERRTFTNPNELHNEEAMEGMFKGIGLAALDLYQDPQAVLKKKMGNFDEADLQKSYTREQDKDDETVTIVSRSCQIGRKLQAQTKTAPPSGFNIVPAEYSSITSGLTQVAAEDEYASLMGVALLDLNPEGDDILILGDKASLTGGDVYPPGYDSLGASTTTGHTRASKVKQDT